VSPTPSGDQPIAQFARLAPRGVAAGTKSPCPSTTTRGLRSTSPRAGSVTALPPRRSASSRRVASLQAGGRPHGAPKSGGSQLLDGPAQRTQSEHQAELTKTLEGGAPFVAPASHEQDTPQTTASDKSAGTAGTAPENPMRPTTGQCPLLCRLISGNAPPCSDFAAATGGCSSWHSGQQTCAMTPFQWCCNMRTNHKYTAYNLKAEVQRGGQHLEKRERHAHRKRAKRPLLSSQHHRTVPPPGGLQLSSVQQVAGVLASEEPQQQHGGPSGPQLATHPRRRQRNLHSAARAQRMLQQRHSWGARWIGVLVRRGRLQHSM
jgi:hypothetical protein